MVLCMDVSTRIEIACRASGISGAELARRAGLPRRQALYQIKVGDRPGLKYLEKIASVLGVQVEWLTSGSNGPAWANPRSVYLSVRRAVLEGHNEDDRVPPELLETKHPDHIRTLLREMSALPRGKLPPAAVEELVRLGWEEILAEDDEQVRRLDHNEAVRPILLNHIKASSTSRGIFNPKIYRTVVAGLTGMRAAKNAAGESTDEIDDALEVVVRLQHPEPEFESDGKTMAAFKKAAAAELKRLTGRTTWSKMEATDG